MGEMSLALDSEGWAGSGCLDFGEAWDHRLRWPSPLACFLIVASWYEYRLCCPHDTVRLWSVQSLGLGQ